MTPIGELVSEIYCCIEQKNNQKALRALYMFLQITARKRYKVHIANQEMAKAILTERMWMILPMGCQYVLTSGLKLKVQVKGVQADEDGYITLDNILYQAMEDATQDCENNIEWKRDYSLVQGKAGHIFLNEKLLWGLLLALITCKENQSERTADMYWMKIATVKTFINELWGREDFVRKVFSMDYGVEL